MINKQTKPKKNELNALWNEHNDDDVGKKLYIFIKFIFKNAYMYRYEWAVYCDEIISNDDYLKCSQNAAANAVIISFFFEY